MVFCICVNAIVTYTHGCLRVIKFERVGDWIEYNEKENCSYGIWYGYDVYRNDIM